MIWSSSTAVLTVSSSFCDSLKYLILKLLLLFRVLLLLVDCLVDLVVKASALRVEDLGFESSWQWDFFRWSHASDLKLEMGAPVATLPGARRYTVSAGTGRPGVSILSCML